MSDRWVDYLRIDEIRTAIRNPKRHDDDGIRASIAEHGVVELPQLDERTQRLVAGHGRLRQLLDMRHHGDPPPDGVRVDDDGHWLMPVLRGWSSKSDQHAEAYVVASNKLTINGGWDGAELTALLRDLGEVDEHLAAITGFSADERQALLAIDGDDPPPPKRRKGKKHECPSCGYQWTEGDDGT